MDNKVKVEKSKKFEEFYVKFLKKCLTEDIIPIPLMKYEPRGIFAYIDFTEVSKEEKENILKDLNKSSK